MTNPTKFDVSITGSGHWVRARVDGVFRLWRGPYGTRMQANRVRRKSEKQFGLEHAIKDSEITNRISFVKTDHRCEAEKDAERIEAMALCGVQPDPVKPKRKYDYPLQKTVKCWLLAERRARGQSDGRQDQDLRV